MVAIMLYQRGKYTALVHRGDDPLGRHQGAVEAA